MVEQDGGIEQERLEGETESRVEEKEIQDETNGEILPEKFLDQRYL